MRKVSKASWLAASFSRSPSLANLYERYVVCGEQPAQHLKKPPVLAVEVLSDSTRDRDLTAKRPICREHGVANFLTIDSAPNTLVLMTRDGESSFTAKEIVRLSLGDHCDVIVEGWRLFDVAG